MFVSGPAGIDIVTSMFCQVAPVRRRPAAEPSETPAVAKNKQKGKERKKGYKERKKRKEKQRQGGKKER